MPHNTCSVTSLTSYNEAYLSPPHFKYGHIYQSTMVQFSWELRPSENPVIAIRCESVYLQHLKSCLEHLYKAAIKCQAVNVLKLPNIYRNGNFNCRTIACICTLNSIIYKSRTQDTCTVFTVLDCSIHKHKPG